MQTLLSLAIDALAYAMVLFVVSVGLSLSMGLMRVVNLAHGGFAMVGGYLAAYATGALGLPYAAAIVVGVAMTVLVSIPLERLLYRRIYRAPDLLQVLMTIGIVFCIVGVMNGLFGPTLKTIALPPALSGSIDLGFRSIAGQKLFVIACGFAVALGLWLLLTRTQFGIQLRAVIDNAPIAATLGVKTAAIYAVGFSLAVGLAAFGGIIGAEVLPMEPNYALRYLATFLVVVSVGGAGSISGALLACLLLGAIETGTRYFAPDYGALFFYAAVIAIVLAFPNGLTARRAFA